MSAAGSSGDRRGRMSCSSHSSECPSSNIKRSLCFPRFLLLLPPVNTPSPVVFLRAISGFEFSSSPFFFIAVHDGFEASGGETKCVVSPVQLAHMLLERFEIMNNTTHDTAEGHNQRAHYTRTDDCNRCWRLSLSKRLRIGDGRKQCGKAFAQTSKLDTSCKS